MSTKVFDDIEEIQIEDIILPKAKALLFLRDTELLKQQIPTIDPETMQQLIMLKLLEKATNKNPLFLLESIKDGYLQILPKSLLFKVINYIPNDIIKKTLNFGIEVAKDELSG